MSIKRHRGDDLERIDLAKIDTISVDPVWDSMPLADFQRFGRYIRTIADTLGLREWEIRLRLRPEVEEDDNDQAPLATIKVSPEGRFATIRLATFFAHEDHELQQESLIHEVLHIYFETLLVPFTDRLDVLIGEAHAATITALLDVDKERTIDAIAVAISPLMPQLPKR